jgi:hypothetical protein
MDLFNDMYTRLLPIIKWAGGKERELPFIFSNAPREFEDYYEPFVGGGSVFMAFGAQRYFINDKSEELINLYRSIGASDADFLEWINSIDAVWGAMLAFVEEHQSLCNSYLLFREGALSDKQMKASVLAFLSQHSFALNNVLSPSFKWHRNVYLKELQKNLVRKTARMRQIEQRKGLMKQEDVYENIETAFMSSIYMYFRCLYNDRELMSSNRGLSTAIFVFIRNYAYSGMFRYSRRGDFNVPYGGIGYNHKRLQKKVDYYKSAPLIERLNSTMICNQDFEAFFRSNTPQENDFVFLDPPYDSEFSTYAQNVFSLDDHRRLANYLIGECRAKWMMIIKSTPYILSLYSESGLTIKAFDKKYLVSFMNRNDKSAEHLIIMNY